MQLTETRIYQKAFREYLRFGTPMEISIKAMTPTTPYYIWRTQGDDKVRAPHAANNGKVFAWAHPPATGNPGEAPHCRCWAEPYTKVPTVAEMGLLLAGIGLIRVGGPVGRVIGGRVIQRVSGDLIRRVRSGGSGIFRRPDKVPKDWIEKPTKDGNGVQYVDSKNAYNEVRVQKGNPESSNVGQQQDYVTWKNNGHYLDKYGNEVLRKSLESHIPIEEFQFKPELFK